jgi:hypothetical protein
MKEAIGSVHPTATISRFEKNHKVRQMGRWIDSRAQTRAEKTPGPAAVLTLGASVGRPASEVQASSSFAWMPADGLAEVTALIARLAA